jgi:hypothetical protein
MRLSRWNSLVIVAGLLLLSGCFRPWTSPGYGYGYGATPYGSPAYGGYQGYQGYGGYQGIQTLQPGQYYDPLTGGTPTFAPGTSNGLTPEPSPAGGGGGAGDSGGNAPDYNPQGESPASRPVPMYPENGAGLQPPATEGQGHDLKPDMDAAPGSTQLRQAPSGSWANDPISPVAHEEAASEPAAMEAPAIEGALPLNDEPTTEGETTAEAPPLLSSPEAPPEAP